MTTSDPDILGPEGILPKIIQAQEKQMVNGDVSFTPKYCFVMHSVSVMTKNEKCAFFSPRL